MSVTQLQLLAARPGEGQHVLESVGMWREQQAASSSAPERVLLLAELRRPEHYVVLSDWPDDTPSDELEAASLDLGLRLADLLIFEPASYRLRPLRDGDGANGMCDYVGASLTFAPEALAATVEQVAIAEGERLSRQPGFAWTKRLRNIAGPTVVFTCSGWASHADFERALAAVMEPVEDRIDLLGCKQVFFSLSPCWEPATRELEPESR